MSAQHASDPDDVPAPVSVPGHAWAWLQRSRPVLNEAARRLTGGPATPTFLDELRAAYASDPFTRAVVADVVAEVAFSGRVPAARPPGASWDRGLTWWAAALSGTTPRAFESRAPAEQRRLFDAGSEPAAATGERTSHGPPPAHLHISRERRALAAALRDLLRSGDGDQVPASAVRQLADALDPRD